MMESSKKRKRPARPIKYPAKAEKYYASQLKTLINSLAQQIDEQILPALRRNYTADRWVFELFSKIIIEELSPAISSMHEKLARSAVVMAEIESSNAFIQQINRVLGVDISGMIAREALSDYVDLAVTSNVNLITSLSTDYFSEIERIVTDGMMQGEGLRDITAKLQRATNATHKRAKLIARDQMAKIRSDVTRKRQANAGITRFKWSTSADVRVSGNPAGTYPNTKIKCFAIAKQDIGYGPGVYLISDGARYGGEVGLFPGRAHVNCRCSQIPQIEGIDY